MEEYHNSSIQKFFFSLKNPKHCIHLFPSIIIYFSLIYNHLSHICLRLQAQLTSIYIYIYIIMLKVSMKISLRYLY